MICAINRIKNLFKFIKDENLVKHGRMGENDFTRNSPLNFVNLILIHINKHGLTNYMEIRNFFKKIKGIRVSKQAFSKARKKLNPHTFKILKDSHLSEFYGANEVKKFKNHIILAGDGSKCKLPNIESLKTIFKGGLKRG